MGLSYLYSVSCPQGSGAQWALIATVWDGKYCCSTPHRGFRTTGFVNQLSVSWLSHLSSCLSVFLSWHSHAWVTYLFLTCPCRIYLSNLSSVSIPLPKLTAPALTWRPPPTSGHPQPQYLKCDPWTSNMEHHMRACQECGRSGSTPDPLKQQLHFNKIPGDQCVHEGLRSVGAQ